MVKFKLICINNKIRKLWVCMIIIKLEEFDVVRSRNFVKYGCR